MPRPVLPVILLCAGLAAPAFPAELDNFVPVTDAMLEQPAPGDWLIWRRTQNGWAYSPLTQINKRTVATLETGVDARRSATALRKRRRSSTAA